MTALGRNAGTGDVVRQFDRWAEQRVTDRDRFTCYNGGDVVLGALVAALAGRPYPEYVEREMLSPLGMDRSTFVQTPTGQKTRWRRTEAPTR